MSEKLSLAIENDALGGPSHDLRTLDLPKQNTDRELWRESADRSQCTPSIHVTQDGGIGINVGGTVIVRPIREWHDLAIKTDLAAAGIDMTEANKKLHAMVAEARVAKPEQPPFEPGQRVRTNDGRVLDVSRCEKRHVPGKLRWVVDDLNGARAFADECELFEGVKPEVRYACSKRAAVGDTVKVLGSNPPLHMKVEEISPTGGLYIKSPTGTACMLLNSSQVEFVPEANLPESDAELSEIIKDAAERTAAIVDKHRKCAESDHIVEANKMVEPAASNSVLGVRHWQDANRGVEVVSKSDYDAVAASRDEWERECESQRKAIREGLGACQSMGEQLTIAKLLLGQCDNRLFLVGKLELRRKSSGWSVFDPVANMFDDERFADPIAAYQRAKALLEAFGQEAGAT